MNVIYPLLLIGALVCFVAAAMNVTTRFQLVAAGLALWVLVPLIQLMRVL